MTSSRLSAFSSYRLLSSMIVALPLTAGSIVIVVSCSSSWNAITS